jgi:hypothetical protein
MDFSKYVNKMEYPNKNKYTKVGYVDTELDVVVWLDAGTPITTNYVKFKETTDIEAYKAYQKEYWNNEAELHDMFFKDCLEDYGLPVNKFSDSLLNIAWDKGHSDGLEEVYNLFGDYYTLYNLAEEVFAKEK